MQLLRYFITHEGKVLSRLDILDDVWNHNPDVTVRTIDNFVLRLRRIIESNPAEPRHILSVRGTGYRFVAQPSGDVGASASLTDARENGTTRGTHTRTLPRSLHVQEFLDVQQHVAEFGPRPFVRRLRD